jgi:putative SbcD/Mre11-related phosphoesterase
MNAERIKLAADLWLDARRAAWLERARTLVVADLHLGYAWVQRRRGQLWPLHEVEDVTTRLLEMQGEYQPTSIVFLGDLIHDALATGPMADLLAETLHALAPRSRLLATLGNHDRQLGELAEAARLPLVCVNEHWTGNYRLCHGHVPVVGAPPPGGSGREWLVMGHEHPAVILGDGLADRVQCPCFVVGERRLLLPAFSQWAAGSVLGRAPFLSPLASEGRWREVVAIVGHRLLRVPWDWIVGRRGGSRTAC